MGAVLRRPGRIAVAVEAMDGDDTTREKWLVGDSQNARDTCVQGEWSTRDALGRNRRLKRGGDLLDHRVDALGNNLQTPRAGIGINDRHSRVYVNGRWVGLFQLTRAG